MDEEGIDFCATYNYVCYY